MAIKKQPRIDKTRQLFVDDSIIAESRGTHRTLHQLTKDSDNPIVHCDRPWEGNDIRAYGSIWREPGDGQLRMWYLARPRDLDDRRFFTSVCYATSTDGFTGPNLICTSVTFGAIRPTMFAFSRTGSPTRQPVDLTLFRSFTTPVNHDRCVVTR